MKLFDGFTAGEVLGQHELVIDQAALDGWCVLFGDGAVAGELPAGFVSVVSMRAYASVVAPRPPGNVHGMQGFALRRLPRLGETLRTTVHCVDKEVRKERRWVGFLTETVDESGAGVFSGRMKIAWAA